MKKQFALFVLTLGLLVFVGCSEKDAPVGPKSMGSIDATVFVSVGNSLTAGYQSGALFASAQEFSFPNLIAKQLGTSFVQPTMPDPGTGSLIILDSLAPKVVLRTSASNAVLPSNAATHLFPYNNLGVPGAVLLHVLDTSDLETRTNPYFRLILRNKTAFGSSVLQQAMKLNPTLMTFWLGNNDVLGYATSGGTRGSNLGLDGSTPFTLPTEMIVFRNTLGTIFAQIKAKLPNTKVVVGNIPGVKNVPFFNTVPRKIPNPLNPSQLLSIYYRAKDNSVKVVGNTDYVLLTAQTKLSQGIGLIPNAPLADADVLEESEVAITDKAITDFNAEIQAAVTTAGSNFALADMYALFENLKKNGSMIAGEKFTTDFISGGLFSLDGIHTSNKGAGFIANEFILTMNRAFGANIPFVEISRLPGLTAPLGKRPAGFLPSIVMTDEVAKSMLSLN